jgi:hypothetical protein
MRKSIMALLAAVSMAVAIPGAASARGPGGGGFHGGGFHGGFHRGYGGFGPGFALGLGVGYPYYYGGGYYPYTTYSDEDDGCYVLHRRVRTPGGWGYRRVVVCD